MTTKRNVYGIYIEDWTEDRGIPGTGILQDIWASNAESYILTDKKGRTAIIKMKGGYFMITAEYISVFRKM